MYLRKGLWHAGDNVPHKANYVQTTSDSALFWILLLQRTLILFPIIFVISHRGDRIPGDRFAKWQQHWQNPRGQICQMTTALTFFCMSWWSAMYINNHSRELEEVSDPAAKKSYKPRPKVSSLKLSFPNRSLSLPRFSRFSTSAKCMSIMSRISFLSYDSRWS